jgi:hypothetical protein
MHPTSECPEWEYRNDPHYKAILAKEAATVLLSIHDGTLSIQQAAIDTRPSHQQLFSRLIHPQMDYLAGHYRGENFKCLRYRPARIAGNPLVGSPPETVAIDLKEFVKHVRSAVKGLDAVVMLPNSQLSEKEKLKYLVAASCSVFCEFLLIHPYANGNGHIARTMLVWMLARYGYWIKQFPIEPRPKEPEYSTAIMMHQSGKPEPLENLVLMAIIS